MSQGDTTITIEEDHAMAGSRKTSKPNIRRRGDTYTWYAYITAGDGTRRQISRGGFRTIAEAEADRIRHLTDIGQGNYVTPDRITVADFLLHEWLPARRTDLEPSTWQSYEQKIRLHVIPHIGAIGLQQLTPTDLNTLYQQLLTGGRHGPVTSRRHPPELVDRMLTLKAEGLTAAGIADLLRSEGHPSAQDLTRHAVAGILRRQAASVRDTPDPRAGLSARTVLMVHGILAKALADALRWNRVYRNVAKAATRPSSKQVRNLARKTWTPDELHRFFDWLGDNRYRYPFAFAATSGCRRGEILGLRWTDVDLERATATIANQITTDRDHSIVHKDMTKTHDSFVIHLDPATVQLLAEWRARQNDERTEIGGAYQDHGLVFCLEDGRPYHPERFSREFLRKQQQHNNTAEPDGQLPRLTLHGLRHTWATIALANNVPLKVVSDRLNHSTTHITAEVYSHVTPPIARDAADLVGGLILKGDALGHPASEDVNP
ncbi:MAG: site-specific integrase [Acidimicrobiales bacterium]